MLYTEMVTAQAIRHGDLQRLLAKSSIEGAVALQIGGSDPALMAHAAGLAPRFGYVEVNINCGCPSERVQQGAFGACLMDEPDVVARCFGAMRNATDLPLSVKHRIGLGQKDDYGWLCRFIDTLARAGCVSFIVHARNAWLDGLSPKENREIPPLRPDVAARLKRDYPQLRFTINGGIATPPQALSALAQFDAIMIGRAAYRDPWVLREIEATQPSAEAGDATGAGTATTRVQVALMMGQYAAAHIGAGGRLAEVTRHMLGLYHGQPGARHWRRLLSDSAELRRQDPGLIERAAIAAEQGGRQRSDGEPWRAAA